MEFMVVATVRVLELLNLQKVFLLGEIEEE